MTNLQTVTNTIELGKLAEAILAKYPADDHAYISYEESADLIEAQADSMSEANDAKALREIAVRWSELG